MSDILEKMLECLEEGAIGELRDALTNDGRTSPRALRLPSHSVALVAAKLGVLEEAIRTATGISLERGRPTPELLTETDTVKLIRVISVATEAACVFSSATKARRWMASHNSVLGDAPMNLLATETGCKEVQYELLRIDAGDFC